MAGGMIILLGLKKDRRISGDFLGTGMHGGVIYVRGCVDTHQLGKEVKIFKVDGDDLTGMKTYVIRFAGYFGFSPGEILKGEFFKIVPITHRPYGKLYTY